MNWYTHMLSYHKEAKQEMMLCFATALDANAQVSIICFLK